MTRLKLPRINSQGAITMKNSRTDDWFFMIDINQWSKKNRPKGPPRPHKEYKKRGAKRVVDVDRFLIKDNWKKAMIKTTGI